VAEGRPVSARRSRAAAAPGEPGGRAPAAARPASPRASEPGAASRPPSQKRLRELLRASPLVTPELRGHWLRVLPYLTAEQRGELAALLAGEAPGGPATRT